MPNRASRSADHPRSRGEYTLVPTLRDRVPGSSPLSRGILLCKIAGEHLEGIIPALAGNTDRWSRVSPGGTDHPRSRGEYSRRTGASGFASGSSPLSRGIRGDQATCHAACRIIPALAGNTARPQGIRPRRADHPRSRGEYLCCMLGSDTETGSSPLSRGIHFASHNLGNLTRIIPALAGNTRTTRMERALQSDHPRSRGEYVRDNGHGRMHEGSSPLSRGIPLN